MKYKNPVISGFYPDPSICRVEEDYYLVTSSFEFFPAIPLFHSKNLVDWKQIGYCVTKSSYLPLMHGNPNASGIYAPTIRYHKGRFYVICTNVTTAPTTDKRYGNFIISTDNPYGNWSEPVWLSCKGIDPSLFFDHDGKAYFCGTYGGIYYCEINPDTGELLSEEKYIWYGTGGCCPEAPHIYYKDHWYYLMIAEGGTEYGHMETIARSRNIGGPYESYDKNPILTNRSLGRSIMATGHADLVETKTGDWWAVCLGIRPIAYPLRHNLGRETFLMPVHWTVDEWPVIGENGIVEEIVEVEPDNEIEVKPEKEIENKSEKKIEVKPEKEIGNKAEKKIEVEPEKEIGNKAEKEMEDKPEREIEYKPSNELEQNFINDENISINVPKGEEPFEYYENFVQSTPNLRWNYQYNPMESYYEWGNGELRLLGMKTCLSDADNNTFVGIRQMHHECTISTQLVFAPKEQMEEAGLTVYMNRNHHYEIAMLQQEGSTNLIVRRKIGKLWKIENEIIYEKGQVWLRIEADRQRYVFSYSEDGAHYVELGNGETCYLTTEVGGNFTGNYIGLYATGNGEESKNYAVFHEFRYQANLTNKEELN